MSAVGPLPKKKKQDVCRAHLEWVTPGVVWRDEAKDTKNKVASQGNGKQKLQNRMGSLFPLFFAKFTKQAFLTVQELRGVSSGDAPRITRHSRNSHPWQGKEGN